MCEKRAPSSHKFMHSQAIDAQSLRQLLPESQLVVLAAAAVVVVVMAVEVVDGAVDGVEGARAACFLADAAAAVVVVVVVSVAYPEMNILQDWRVQAVGRYIHYYGAWYVYLRRWKQSWWWDWWLQL